MTNETRAKAIIAKYQFDFEKIEKSEIRTLIENEIARYQNGSSEYIRCLCGYLFCIGDETDAPLIEKAKFGISMDVGCMINEEWINSLNYGGVATELVRSRSEIIDDFISYYRSWTTPSEKVLFEEVPAEDRTYRKWTLFGAIASFFGSALMLAFAVLIVVVLWDKPIVGIGIGGMFFLLAAMAIYSGIAVLYSRRQFIRIYADRIVYRKQFQKTERIIHLHPQDYKIKLHNAAILLGSYPYKFVTELIFLDANGKKLLSYKAPTLNRSPYQSPRHKWEDDLLELECEILDPEEIIINK